MRKIPGKVNASKALTLHVGTELFQVELETQIVGHFGVHMKWKLVRVVALCAVAILAVVLASDRHSQAQATSPAPATYTYKVVTVRGGREVKDLEPRLNDNARNGWRVWRVVAPSFNNELIIILEKSASAH